MTPKSLKTYRPSRDLLAGRTILVTGAGDGIGKAAAMSFAAHGATVVLLGRTVRKLENAYDAMRAAGHPEPAIYPMDLLGAAPQDYEDLASRLEDECERLDGLLLNAGLLGVLSPFEQYDIEQWMHVMHVNVTSQFLLVQACLPLLRRSRDASIVFTSSGVGRQGRAYWGAYSVSKFATEGMMEVLADELEGDSSIRANSINPGATRTRMRAAAYPAENPASLPAPDEIMGAYLFLMGPDARGVNGKSLDAQ